LKVPTHIVIKNGKQIHHGYEFLPKEVLIDWVQDALNK
jgi:hypothetical protein